MAAHNIPTDLEKTAPQTVIRTTSAIKICRLLVGPLTLQLSSLITLFFEVGSPTTGEGVIQGIWIEQHKNHNCLPLEHASRKPLSKPSDVGRVHLKIFIFTS